MAGAQTFHLVDGHAGTAHIDGDSISRKNQSTLGFWDDILPLHSRFNVTVLDATHIQLGNGGGYIKGRFFYIDTPTKLEVKAGTTGLNRWDALVLRYHRDGDGVETVNPLIITGTATYGQPTLPATLAGNDPAKGNTDADLLLGRIELTGTNITYTRLAAQSDSVKNIGANLQQEITDRQNAVRSEQTARQNGDTANADTIRKVDAHVGSVESALNSFKREIDTIYTRKLVSDNDFNVSGVVVNGMAIITIRWANRGGFYSRAWEYTPIAEITNGWRCDFEIGNWSIDNSVFDDCWFSLNGNRISFRTRSAHDISAGTWHYCTITAPVHK